MVGMPSFIQAYEVIDFYGKDTAIVEITLTINGVSLSVTGEAKRNPMDSVDPALGVEIATARALKQMSKQLQKLANRHEAENAVADKRKRQKRSEGTLEADAKEIVTWAHRTQALKSKNTVKKAVKKAPAKTR